MAIAIKAGWVWDGTRDEAIRDGVVIVDGDRIAAVGPAAAIDIPGDTEVIDRGDEFVLPGLIDAHTHISIIPGHGDQIGQLLQPVERQAIRGAGNLRRMLRTGVTTARIMAEEHWLDVTFKEEVSRGTTPGPRLNICTRAITQSNGHGRALSAADGVDEIRRFSRQNLHAGADFLKLFITGGVSSTRGGGIRAASYSREEIRVAVEEADRAGTYVAAHAIGGPGIRLGVEEGIRTIEHAVMATDDDLALIKERGAWVVLTQAILLHPTGIEQGDHHNPVVMKKPMMPAPPPPSASAPSSPPASSWRSAPTACTACSNSRSPSSLNGAPRPPPPSAPPPAMPPPAAASKIKSALWNRVSSPT